MQIKLEAEGFERAIAGMAQLTPRLQRNVIAAANRSAMKVYLQAAIAAAPVRRPKTSGATVLDVGRTPRTPGYLRRQLKVKAVRKRPGRGVIAHVLHKRKAYYLRFVVKGRGGRGQGSKPNPFLRHVYQSHRSQVLSRWSAEFVRRFDREVKRLHG